MKLLLVLIFLAAIVLGPFITIWALNLLFGLTIPFTIWTYLATLWLSGIVYGASSK